MEFIVPILPELFFNSTFGLIVNDTYFSRAVLYSITLAMFPLASMVGAPILGAISDKIGRREIIVYGMGLLALDYSFCVILILMHNVWLFILTRLFSGFLSGTFSVASAL